MSSLPSSSSAASPVSASLVRSRRPVGWVLLAVALAAFVGGAWLFARTFQAAAKPAEGASEVEKLARDRADAVGSASTSESVLGGLGLLTLAAVLGTAGVVTLSSLPKPTAAAQEADARRALVLFGGLAGLTLMVVGFAFAVEWYHYLGEWLDAKSPPPGAYRFVLALLVFVCGAGLAFASALPARVDERDDPLVRRLVFGMNLGLSTFLLLVLLVVGNIFITLKVPNKLDTTASGLNSITLSESTGEYLDALTTPVTVTTTVSEETNVGADVHRLLDACRARNPQSVTVKYLSRSLDKDKVKELATRFPAADLGGDGLLVTAGRDEERYSFLPMSDLITQPDARGEGPPRTEFIGESKLMRELLFLSDNKSKPILYFTAGHGEFELTPPDPGSPPPPGPRRPTGTLRAALDKSYFEVRPLRFDAANPAVPADATVLVVADPRVAFSPAEAAAVKAYLKAAPGATGKGGKLILIAGPVQTPDRKGLIDIGLDGVLTDYGVTLGRKLLFSQPLQEASSLMALAVVADSPDKDSPFYREFGRERRDFFLPLAREVIVSPPGGPGSAARAEPLLVSYPNRPTWLESEVPASPSRAYQQVTQDPEVRLAKEAEPGGRRVLAATASEGGKGKVAVFGSGNAFLDANPRAEPHDAELSAQLFTVTVNWLREQPPVANIAAKTYGTYAPNPKLDLLRFGVLPVLMASLMTAALGVGVWIVRRK